jgi:hypothetical protein
MSDVGLDTVSGRAYIRTRFDELKKQENGFSTEFFVRLLDFVRALGILCVLCRDLRKHQKKRREKQIYPMFKRYDHFRVIDTEMC